MPLLGSIYRPEMKNVPRAGLLTDFQLNDIKCVCAVSFESKSIFGPLVSSTAANISLFTRDITNGSLCSQWGARCEIIF